MEHLSVMFLIKFPFIGDFPLPCLITGGYVNLPTWVDCNHSVCVVSPLACSRKSDRRLCSSSGTVKINLRKPCSVQSTVNMTWCCCFCILSWFFMYFQILLVSSYLAAWNHHIVDILWFHIPTFLGQLKDFGGMTDMYLGERLMAMTKKQAREEFRKKKLCYLCGNFPRKTQVSY